MSMPKDTLQKDILEAWRTYLDSLEKSLVKLEEEINEAEEMAAICTDEWCEATEHYIDDIGNALFSISEPRWADQADSDRIRKLKRRLHDIYSNYKGVYEKAAQGTS